MIWDHGKVTPVHGVFAILWIVWFLGSLVYLAHVSSTGDRILVVEIVIATYFGAAEAIAASRRVMVEWKGTMVALRDTMSQFMTWVARMSKPGTPWYLGWNALVVALAFVPSTLVAQATPDIAILGGLGLSTRGLMWAAFEAFLVAHWIRPDKVG